MGTVAGVIQELARFLLGRPPSIDTLFREYPGLSEGIVEPAPRNCCAIFPGGVDLPVPLTPPFLPTKYLGPEDVPGHRYGESGFFPADSVGQLYTERGGFVDLGHVRDLADTARYLAMRTISLQRAGGEVLLAPEYGSRRVRQRPVPGRFPSVELARLIAARAAYDLAIWHEIGTWYGNIRHSSFSPEDNFSNLLGALIGAAAATTRNRPYDAMVDELLTEQLRELHVQPAGVARQAIEAVTGLWFDPENDLLGPSVAHLLDLSEEQGNRVLWRRHMVPAPSVTPWLVTDLNGRSFTVPDPVAGPGRDQTVDFDLGTPRPTPVPLTVPAVTAAGEPLTDFYSVEIVVDTQEVPARVLPAGRTQITDRDLGGIVDRVRGEVLEAFPHGDLPIDPR
jgi:Protein of unknown function (DUF4056)